MAGEPIHRSTAVNVRRRLRRLEGIGILATARFVTAWRGAEEASATIGAEVAQSVEHRPEEAGVVSSILTLGTSNAVSSGTSGRKWLSW